MRRYWALTAIAIAGIGVGLLAEHVSIDAHVPENHVLDVAVGWTYLAAGIVALARRPGNRFGLLLVVFGFTWFIGNFGNVRDPVVFSLGSAFESTSAAVLAHAILAYPSGRLTQRWERRLVFALYGWIAVFGLVHALTFDPRTQYDCPRCVHGGLALLANASAFDALNQVGDVAGTVFSIGVIALLVVRFRSASPFMRRELTPLWVAAGLVAVVFAAEGLTSNTLEWEQKLGQALIPLVFLAGLLRSRLAESAVAPLVTQLARPLRRGELRDLLSRALGDPALGLAFAVPAGGFVDEAGRPVAPPADDGARTTTFVPAEGPPIAALIHDRALLDRRPLVDAVGAAARLALENERLHAEVRAQLEEVRASRARIVEAADAERRRVERNLHDGAQQRLVTLSLELALARERAEAIGDGELVGSLQEASNEVAEALAELRELGRGLHPAILTEAGLGPALESLAERSPVPARLHWNDAGRLATPIEAGAYFVASEALANTAKHARASRVELRGDRLNGSFRLEIADDGVGGADAAGGTGLAGLADRVASLGGSLSIESARGNGTRIVAQFPCE
jgi:signal transduction histidine kinase